VKPRHAVDPSKMDATGTKDTVLYSEVTLGQGLLIDDQAPLSPNLDVPGQYCNSRSLIVTVDLAHQLCEVVHYYMGSNGAKVNTRCVK
jgi:hypothetical protein